jgi:hypothetical protein
MDFRHDQYRRRGACEAPDARTDELGRPCDPDANFKADVALSAYRRWRTGCGRRWRRQRKQTATTPPWRYEQLHQMIPLLRLPLVDEGSDSGY